MSEKRGPEEIRKEIAAERGLLDADLNALQSELRSLVPVVAAGLALVALVSFSQERKSRSPDDLAARLARAFASFRRT